MLSITLLANRRPQQQLRLNPSVRSTDPSQRTKLLSLGDFRCRLRVRASRDRFLHQLPTTLRQRPQSASAQIPEAFVSVARVNENDAFTCGSVVKSGTRMFRDKLKKRLPPRSIRIIKHLLAKLFEFFNADDSDGLCDSLASLVVDSVSVLKFF